MFEKSIFAYFEVRGVQIFGLVFTEASLFKGHTHQNFVQSHGFLNTVFIYYNIQL